MKTTTIAIAIIAATTLSSCEKQIIEPKPLPVAEDSLKYNLDFSSATLGIHMVDMKPEWISPMVQFENGQNRRFGDLVTFQSTENDIILKFYYWYGRGVTQCTGRIGDKTFTVDIELNTMSICGGLQGVPVIFDLFSEPGETNS